MKGKTPRDRAWDAFSLYIRERDNWTCCCCGAVNYRNKSGKIMQAGHLITRQRASTLFDEDNVFCQCAPCNNQHRFKPEIMTQWWVKRFGGEAYLKLCEKAWKVVQRRASDYNAIRYYYEKKREELERKRRTK